MINSREKTCSSDFFVRRKISLQLAGVPPVTVSDFFVRRKNSLQVFRITPCQTFSSGKWFRNKLPEYHRCLCRTFLSGEWFRYKLPEKTHVLVSDFSRPENYFVTSCRNNAGARRKCQTNYSFFPFFQHYSVLTSINIGSLTYSIILGK